MGQTAIDPVCKMNVDIATAPASADFDGVTYYFCMSGCKDQFVANPRKFLPSADKSEKGWKKLFGKNKGNAS